MIVKMLLKKRCNVTNYTMYVWNRVHEICRYLEQRYIPEERSPLPGVPAGPFMHLAIAMDMSMAVVHAMSLSHQLCHCPAALSHTGCSAALSYTGSLVLW